MLGARMWFLFVILVIVLLLVFPRQVLPILVATAILLGAGGGWYWWQHRQLQAELDAVEVAVVYDPAECPAETPLLVTIVNGSTRNASNIQWQFSARRSGYRGELTGGWTVIHVLDQVLPAGQQYRQCYVAPRPNEHVVRRDADELANLTLSIRNKRVTFAE